MNDEEIELIGLEVITAAVSANAGADLELTAA
jgi:hypothetical protein